jgi:hydrogenase-4 component B
MSYFFSPAGFYLMMALFAAGSIISLVFRNSDRLANIFGHSFAIAGSGLGLIFSGQLILTSSHLSFNLPTSFIGFIVSFNIDQLSAFFVLIISLLGFVSSIYAFGYTEHYYGRYNIGLLGFFYNAFIAGMLLVVTSSNMLLFLISWELMSLTSYFLVIFERKDEKNIKAGTLYFIMTHIGTAFIILAFLLLYRATGSVEFEAVKTLGATVSPIIKNSVFFLALIGFGTKAGIIPLHIWLPSAHPAAPSHVSALMSGVMIKTGIYMLIRLFVDILPNIPAWWGLIILFVGSVSALLGVLYALTEHDLKKLLAYHSIENIGIILLGFGSSLFFLSQGLTGLAAAALVASLFHTANHAIFKGLLFLGAGSVISATHTRNIEKYGGLIRYMPETAFFFLIGSMAISALPPFNGFASEWLTFQSLLSGIYASALWSKLIFALSTGALAFTGGLAAACFVKAFGATFLARPRSTEIKQAKEASFSLRLGMMILALLTLVVGLNASAVSSILSGIVSELNGLQNGIIARSTASLTSGFGSSSLPLILIGLTAALASVFLFLRLVSRDQKVTLGSTWDCGSNLTPRMEITATGLSRSIITVFKNILRPTKEMETIYHDEEQRYFPKDSTIRLELHDIYRSYVYQPIASIVTAVSERARKIQGGNINAYILYIFITLIGLLIVIAS